MGWQPNRTGQLQKQVRAQLGSGDHSSREIAKTYIVHHSTVVRLANG